MKAHKHVILFSYSPVTKQHERYDALVIGSREFEDHDEPVLNLVHFRHDDTASHHALNGVDWADTLERTLDVPHKGDVKNQSFYYIEDEAESLRPQLESAHEVLREYDRVVDDLKAQLADATKPGPSLVTETKHYSDGSSATGPTPLPEQSPAQQDAGKSTSKRSK